MTLAGLALGQTLSSVKAGTGLYPPLQHLHWKGSSFSATR